MTDPFDELIEKTKEKYRVSWENSLEKFKKFCAIQDDQFEWAIKYGKFYPKITIEKIVVEAKSRKLRAEYSLVIDPLDKNSFQMYKRPMNVFEKLQASWWWTGQIFEEWCWTMTHDDGEFFQFLQTDYIQYEEDMYYMRKVDL